MKDPTPLERLISRELDGECTARERESLRRCVRDDDEAGRLLEECRRIDDEAGRFLRQALRREDRAHPRFRLGWLRYFSLAAAACLGTLAWLHPATLGTGGRTTQAVQGASLFAHPAGLRPADQYDAEAALELERPQLRLRHSSGDWLILRGATPQEFLILEVKRVKSRTVFLQEDF